MQDELPNFRNGFINIKNYAWIARRYSDLITSDLIREFFKERAVDGYFQGHLPLHPQWHNPGVVWVQKWEKACPWPPVSPPPPMARTPHRTLASEARLHLECECGGCADCWPPLLGCMATEGLNSLSYWFQVREPEDHSKVALSTSEPPEQRGCWHHYQGL